MPEAKRKRRPGAGRPPIDRQGSVIAQVRFTQDDWKAIEVLASKHHKSNVSKEIRAAVHYWLRLLEKPKLHVGALICLIAILIRRIEAHTGHKWFDDPVTGTAVREEIGRLIDGFVPVTKERPVVPPELRQIARDLIVITAHLYREPQLSLALSGDDWAVLALIAKDLGPTLLRNLDKTVVTISEVKS
jgi:hypothetical protein